MRRASAAAAALVVLGAVAMALAAPAAQADHVAPSVTATLVLDDAVRDCSASGLCARARRSRPTTRRSPGRCG